MHVDDPMACAKCGDPNALPAPHTGMRLCDSCCMGLLTNEPAVRSLPFPHGTYDLYADDDDVIGQPVARTHPQGWFLIRTDPPIMDAFDEFEVGNFLAWCLTNAERLLPMMTEEARQ